MSQGREVVVGVVIVAAAVVVVLGTLFLKGARWGAEVVEVDVLVQDVGQLMEGNAVALRGVEIGTVRSIEVEPSGEAVRLRLLLDAEVRLPDGAVVVIAPESLFGDWQAEIVTVDRFPRLDYYVVESGTVTDDGIPVIGGAALPDISRLTAAADEISENLAVLTDRFDRAFNEETAENLQLAIRNIQEVSEDIKSMIDQQASTFETVAAEVERTATEISAAAVTARRTLDRADALLAEGQVDTILANVELASRGMVRLVEQVEGIGETLEKADSAFEGIQAITARVQQGEGTLGLLLSDSALYFQAERTMLRLDSLLADLMENPRRYINFSIF